MTHNLPHFITPPQGLVCVLFLYLFKHKGNNFKYNKTTPTSDWGTTLSLCPDWRYFNILLFNLNNWSWACALRWSLEIITLLLGRLITGPPLPLLRINNGPHTQFEYASGGSPQLILGHKVFGHNNQDAGVLYKSLLKYIFINMKVFIRY